MSQVGIVLPRIFTSGELSRILVIIPQTPVERFTSRAQGARKVSGNSGKVLCFVLFSQLPVCSAAPRPTARASSLTGLCRRGDASALAAANFPSLGSASRNMALVHPPWGGGEGSCCRRQAA